MPSESLEYLENMETQGIPLCVSILLVGYSLGVSQKGFVFPWPVAFAVGVFLGLATSVLALTLLWYRMTCLDDTITNTMDDGKTVPKDEGSRGEDRNLQKGTKQGSSLPHAVTTHGCFQDRVYTIKESDWDSNACVLDWPPSLKTFKAWNANIDRGTLILNPVTDSTEPLGIPLARCRVEIVRNGLKGRSDFLRRAPLLIKHEQHAIIEGERGLYLFANSPASKLCWVSALRYWSADGSSGYRQVQEMYTHYCREMMPSNKTIVTRNSQSSSRTRRSWRDIGMRSFRGWKREEESLHSIESLIDREWMGSPEKNKKTSSQDIHFEDYGDEKLQSCKRQESAGTTRWQKDLPGLCPPEMFFNDLLLRCCFDFVRNPQFAEGIASKIQMQLDRIHKPEYVQSLHVVNVDAGSSCPRISNLFSMPPPFSDSRMPQIAFDMKYEGSFSVSIELRVDIRDSKGWGTLDKALDMIEGRPKLSQEGSEEIDLLRTLSGMHEDEVDVVESSTPTTRTILAQRLRKLADSTASRLASIPLRVKLTFSALEGPMCAWVMPPPCDRLFWSFLTPPKISINAKPEFGERVFKYAYHASRVSAWIEARMKLSFRKNLVFPSGGDFRIPGLLSVEDPLIALHGDTESDSQEADDDQEILQDEPSGSRPFFEIRLRR